MFNVFAKLLLSYFIIQYAKLLDYCWKKIACDLCWTYDTGPTNFHYQYYL